MILFTVITWFIKSLEINMSLNAVCLQTRQAFTPELINEACYVDVNANKGVFDSLRNNPKVHYDGKRFSYKVTLNLCSCRTSWTDNFFNLVFKLYLVFSLYLFHGG